MLGKHWGMFRWVTQFLNENQEKWEQERKEREEKIKEEIKEWEKAKRFEKIERIKRLWRNVKQMGEKQKLEKDKENQHDNDKHPITIETDEINKTSDENDKIEEFPHSINKTPLGWTPDRSQMCPKAEHSKPSNKAPLVRASEESQMYLRTDCPQSSKKAVLVEASDRSQMYPKTENRCCTKQQQKQ